MAVQNMEMVANSDPAGKGALYFEKFDAITADSDDYIFPIKDITGIAASITGDGAIEFTQDPPSVIEAGSAVFTAWDGVSLINLALTGFRINRASGAVSAKITVRTRE